MSLVFSRTSKKYVQSTRLRAIGGIITLNVNNGEKSGYVNNVGREIRHHAIAHGVLLYLLGNVLCVMPSYQITENELHWVYMQFDRVLEKVTNRS